MSASPDKAMTEIKSFKPEDLQLGPDARICWLTSTPFIIVHLMPLAIYWTGITWFDLGVCFALYYVRMFFITAGYHRYFAHRSYKLGRVVQFLMALGGSMAGQKGVLWWAAHHRHHHRYSDQLEDVHSPLRGFWWAHLGWVLCDRYNPTRFDLIKDFAKFPELRWINKHWYIPSILLAVACWALGGWSMLVVGYFLSTVLLYHGTFLVNSATHLFGRRRFVTNDTSRNSMIIALLTCGEGWHNNHHHYQSTANQGFYWWEIDFSYYGLILMSWLGLARDLRVPSKSILTNDLLTPGRTDIGMERGRKLAAQIRRANKGAEQDNTEEISVNTPVSKPETAFSNSDKTIFPAANSGYRGGRALE